MATNLRLRPDAEAAVRAEAARTGQSQQELIRAAVDQYLHLTPTPAPRSDMESMVASGAVLPPRSSLTVIDDLLILPEGVTSLDLLEWDDRF